MLVSLLTNFKIDIQTVFLKYVLNELIYQDVRKIAIQANNLQMSHKEAIGFLGFLIKIYLCISLSNKVMVICQ